jgi:hypothetical protein
LESDSAENKQKGYLTNLSPEFTFIYWLSINHIFRLDDIEGVFSADEQLLVILLFTNISVATIMSVR